MAAIVRRHLCVKHRFPRIPRIMLTFAAWLCFVVSWQRSILPISLMVMILALEKPYSYPGTRETTLHMNRTINWILKSDNITTANKTQKICVWIPCDILYFLLLFSKPWVDSISILFLSCEFLYWCSCCLRYWIGGLEIRISFRYRCSLQNCQSVWNCPHCKLVYMVWQTLWYQWVAKRGDKMDGYCSHGERNLISPAVYLLSSSVLYIFDYWIGNCRYPFYLL